MKGGEAILRTAEAAGIEFCFSNPGSTEFELIVAFDVVSSVRPILCLHETVCSGMADGYGRIAGRPAFTLLHQGAGFSNASSNLHNARKAGTPIVNLVGVNAARDEDFTPLASDVTSHARPVSDWYMTASSAATVGDDTAAAIAAASRAPGQVATLILPAGVQSGDGAGPAARPIVERPREVAAATIDHVARLMRDGRAEVALVLHASVLDARGLDAAGRIAATTGCTLFAESIPRRMDRGAGLPAVRLVPGMTPPAALDALRPFRTLVLVGARPHQPYFLLEDTPAPLVPPTSNVVELAAASDDVAGALAALADALGARSATSIVEAAQRPAVPTGALTASTINAVVAALMPEGTIVVQTSTTGSRDFLPITRGCPPHSVLMNTGASIGWGMPAAAGAAMAAPGRRVLHLAADGGDVLAVQALWTQARERLDVTTIVFCNRSYKILQDALSRMAPEAGPRARSLLTLDEPVIDFTAIARGFGVASTRVDTTEGLARTLEGVLRERGPHLIEAVI